jgi:hypothetical protein
MKTITIKAVREAYRKTGFRPLHYRWWRTRKGVKCACPLAALAVAHGVADFKTKPARVAGLLEVVYGHDYITGFIWGVDAIDCTWEVLTPRERAGYNAGLRIYNKLIKVWYEDNK